jgi:hypothetical protein
MSVVAATNFPSLVAGQAGPQGAASCATVTWGTVDVAGQ